MDHVAVDDMFPATTAYRVTGEVNVMLVFPSESPRDVPDQVAAPAPVMSAKSTLASVTLAALSVIATPGVTAKTYRRFVREAPDSEIAPVEVMLPVMNSASLMAACPVKDNDPTVAVPVVPQIPPLGKLNDAPL